MIRTKRSIFHCLLITAALLAAACRSETGLSQVPATPGAATGGGLASPTTPPVATATPSPNPSPTPTAPPTLTPTGTATATATPDPYAGLTIEDIAARAYGGGAIEVVEVLETTGAFTRTLVTYPSEGLTLYGFMNTPRGEGPFPAALVMHGYVSPANYTTLAYTTRYADALARAGYLVIHPNYRNWPPSETGPEKYRAAHAVDALNLIAILRDQAGRPGPLAAVDPRFVGMLGHSMGGGITTRVITARDDVQAAVLYGSMSGDEKQNFEKILEWSGGARGAEELATPPEALERISPIFHVERIDAAVSIHHGENDGTVPLAWSLDLCQRLQALNKIVECFTYPGQPHTFYGADDQLFMERAIEFFNQQYDQAKKESQNVNQ